MPKSGARNVRTDIQALRALAVALVIFDHMRVLQRLPGDPQGGFIGVDVFFVISGFLITGHLLTETASTGRVSFKRFYQRRARRILPLAVLVAGTTILAALIVFWPARAVSSLADGIWSLLFVSNIAFAAQGVNYFDDGTTSIFQHYWSLSVEEQFYIFWPVMIAGVAWGAVKLKRPRPPLMIGAIAALGALAFAWACVDTAQSPTTAYFSTLARAFEFALGALVAAFAGRLSGMPDGMRRTLSAAGLVGVVASVWVIEASPAFPGPAALVPTAAAALFILAGTGTDRNVAVWPARTRAVQYVGDISYSLYLWHWPVIVIVAALMPAGPTSAALTLVVTLALSVASYRWVEQAVLRSGWLSGTRSAPRARPSLAPLARMAVTIAGAALVIGGGTAAAQPDAHRTGAVATRPSEATAQSAAFQQLASDMRAAAATNSWVGLTPDISQVAEVTEGVLTPDCWNDRDTTRDHCYIGPADATTTVAVLGDSMAMNWVPGLWAAIEDRGWRLSVYTKVGCPYADAPVFDTDGSLYEGCEDFRDWAVDAILEERPDSVVLASALKKELPGASGTAELASAWSAGVEATTAKLGGISGAILIAPPEGQALSACANRFTAPDQCGSATTDLWGAVRDSTFVAAAPAYRVVDTGPWFCREDGNCPAVIGTIPVRRDAVHMTDALSIRLAPLLWEFALRP